MAKIAYENEGKEGKKDGNDRSHQQQRQHHLFFFYSATAIRICIENEERSLGNKKKERNSLQRSSFKADWQTQTRQLSTCVLARLAVCVF